MFIRLKIVYNHGNYKRDFHCKSIQLIFSSFYIEHSKWSQQLIKEAWWFYDESEMYNIKQ